MNIFEMATKGKFRYEFKGLISTEDLWDLNIQSLDLIFKSLNAQLKQAEEESLLAVKSKADEEIAVKIEIIKYIVEFKQVALEEKLNAIKDKEQISKLLDALDRKRDAKLEDMSEDDILKELKKLKK